MARTTLRRTVRKTTTAALLLVLLIAAPLGAQESESGEASAESAPPPYERYPEALGVAYGEISGTGLHYHVWHDTIGFSVAAGVVYLPPQQGIPGNLLDYNLGGSVQRRVYGDTFADWLAGSLYLFGGGNHRGYIPVTYSETAPGHTIGAYAASLTAGGGIGIELILFEHFSFPSEFGYAATWTVTEPDLTRALLVQLYAQAAVRYRY